MAELPRSDRPDLVPAESTDAADMVQAFAQFVEPFSREQRIAEVEKARIEADTHKATVEAQERWLSKVVENSLTRFKWLAVIGTLFGLIVCGFAGALIMNGDTTAGLMVISHAVTLAVGVLGGRGLVTRARAQQPDQDG